MTRAHVWLWLLGITISALRNHLATVDVQGGGVKNFETGTSDGGAIQLTCSPGLIVMRWQLLQQVFDAMLLAHRVDVGDLVVGQIGEVEVDLEEGEKL